MKRRIRSDYLDWCEWALNSFGQKPAAHHRFVGLKLQQVADGTHPTGRVMILMPPGSAKSMYGSVLYPAWLFAGRDNFNVLAASHTLDLAEHFSGRVQQRIRDNQEVLSYSILRQAVEQWNTSNGCEYKAAGVGSAIAGFRADLGIIDDAVKSREAVESETNREKAWNWYLSDFLTRLKPSAKQVMIQCMVGDTPVMMADGAWKALRDVRPGDSIATYRNGRLSASTVLKWASQGQDSVYEIKTSSGITVRANARHPFLVRVGRDAIWIRTRDLSPGHEMFRASGANGKARRAAPMVATGPLRCAATALLTTIRSVGLMAFARLRSTRNLCAKPTSSTDTASPKKSMTPFMPSRAADARYVTDFRPNTRLPYGAGSFSWITATIPRKFAGFSVTIATLLSAISGLRMPLNRQRDTSDFIPERIEEIRPCGVEEVFDIQVAETENFIANGLVSHNTRWHEDDLAGRVLKHHGDQWEVVSIPAIAVEGDPLGRSPGQPLWADDAYGYAEDLKVKRSQLGDRDWASLYQQNPTPLEGGVFKVGKIGVAEGVPAGTVWVRGWDFAATKETGTNDPSRTVGVKLGLTPEGRYIVGDVLRFTGGPEEVEATFYATAQRDGRTIPVSAPQDPGQAGKAQVAHLSKKLKGWTFVFTPETGDKATRAAAIASQVNVGNVDVLASAWNDPFLEELRSFPGGAHDDQVDALSRAFHFLTERASIYQRFKALAS